MLGAPFRSVLTPSPLLLIEYGVELSTSLIDLKLLSDNYLITLICSVSLP
jgi:hypothetical protein